ncbi:MAG TPA: hypothetical protein H9780_04990 [Candidatus Mediterraneibacter merdavium]|nr:hypothetical protein [Candidatus Mediterraneibacter merdavium]
MKNIDLHKEYSNFLENDNEPASDSVKLSYEEMRAGFESYLCAVEEHMWINGFKYAMKLMEGKGNDRI